MVKVKRFVVVKHFQNDPKPSDLQLVEEELPDLQNGEFLVQAEYLSVDPYMRVYTQRYPIGITMIGSQVAKIIESKNTEFPVGERIIGYLGWRTHSIINPYSSEYDFLELKPKLLPDIKDLPPSLHLGILGITGNSAYFGLLDICKPKQGEVLVVSGAGGAVGSHVGQIGKILGLTVIGITDSDEKCKWLVEELGFDYAIDYKNEDVEVFLKKAAPNGIDCYFDNVGGEISTIVIYQMKNYGRIAACGSIASYNADLSSLPKSTILQPQFVFNRLKMEGFLISDWYDRWHESVQKNLQWIHEGKLLYRETITKGFENMFDAFVGMLQGKNIGKALVQA
ncbi:prostaglandin reductase 1-like isoform X1 [Frieseomelitta varia]|uniref:prostaglandin reductase 1-like isoform X1 n=2 Tax=Frieseomelitta varia TaxID=561572 RepID=UPI001CB6B426|nr:prostaglandin reductase 1-like isoform X1 [Frieseomelitta varia]